MENDLEPGSADAATADSDVRTERAPRDSANTRLLLVAAARRRFARDGYRATTVRQIAGDAGVNVALISRYFGSKEGLFRSCLQRTVRELEPDDHEPGVTLDELVAQLVRHVADSPDPDGPLQLLLLLRSSGDEDADQIRRATIEAFAARLAVIAGWQPGDPQTGQLVLRAQIALATVLGVVMLRTSAEIEPLTSAGAEDLTDTLGGVIRELFARRES